MVKEALLLQLVKRALECAAVHLCQLAEELLPDSVVVLRIADGVARDRKCKPIPGDGELRIEQPFR